jgi:formylglycine-generating enzyme required for sulfatase activity
MPAQRTRSSVAVGTVAVFFSLFPAMAFRSSSSEVISVETVEIAPRVFTYRMAGDFHLAGHPVDAPAVMIVRNDALRIMRRQVTASEYARCILAGQCRETSSESDSAKQFPAVNVSWEDATAYAEWLSKETGYSWRLPTDEEWAFAAGARFHDDALSIAATSDPSARWLARYEREAENSLSERRPRRIGAFGANEYGLLDLSGNVWEWTNTCFIRQSLDERGATVGASIANCGVRVAEGEHRTYVTDFIRDASKGGCAAGKPPSNLGFRLVREDAAETFILRLKRLLIGLGCLSLRGATCSTGSIPS